MDHLLRVWEQTDAEDRYFGQTAYSMYYSAMKRFGSLYGFGIVPTTEAFVALSPNNDYHGNLRSLATVLFAARTGLPLGPVSTYRGCARRALTYVKGEISFLETVKGKKITAFRHNILYPGTSDRVTIDGHMVCVWSGRDMTMSEANLFLQRSSYDQIEQDFQRAAHRLSVQPLELQATLWMHRKRTRGIKTSDQYELFSGKTRWSEVPNPINYPPFEMEPWKLWLNTVSFAEFCAGTSPV